MSLKKKPETSEEQSGRSLEEDLQRLEESGLMDGSKAEPVDKPAEQETKEQQKTGDTSRSDRRL